MPALRLADQAASQTDPPEQAAASANLREALALAEALGARPAGGHCHLALATLYRFVTASAEGSSPTSQPPPRAWIRSTAAPIRRPRIWTAVT